MSDTGYEDTSWFEVVRERNAGQATYFGDVSPKEAWDVLSQHNESVLVDVRSQAEWHFLGVPNLSSLQRDVQLLQWSSFPDGARNSEFLPSLLNTVPKHVPVLFLCRVGGRSAAAAHMAAAEGYGLAMNIEGGFDGPPDATGHRGTVAGWRAEGLPWIQS